MCNCRCCVSSTDSYQNTFLVFGLYFKSSIPSESPVRKGRKVHESIRFFLKEKEVGI